MRRVWCVLLLLIGALLLAAQLSEASSVLRVDEAATRLLFLSNNAEAMLVVQSSLPVKEPGWAVDQYDILPDRVIVYLWPHAGGNRFQFKFRPRFGLAAHTAPSVVYDYYNPEARAVVAPTRFIVR